MRFEQLVAAIRKALAMKMTGTHVRRRFNHGVFKLIAVQFIPGF